jgi:hypothetical protein
VGDYPEDDGQRVLACSKNNLTEPPLALGFCIQTNESREATVAWTGPLDLSAHIASNSLELVVSSTCGSA